MGNRLSKIYTRSGDDGTTGLANGSRVDKDCARMEAIGCIDELNSIIGMVLSHEATTDELRSSLSLVQHDLFDIGAELCQPGKELITDDYVAGLENSADEYNAGLGDLKEFILPGGSPARHLRLCRRAACTGPVAARYRQT